MMEIEKKDGGYRITYGDTALELTDDEFWQLEKEIRKISVIDDWCYELDGLLCFETADTVFVSDHMVNMYTTVGNKEIAAAAAEKYIEYKNKYPDQEADQADAEDAMRYALHECARRDILEDYLKKEWQKSGGSIRFNTGDSATITYMTYTVEVSRGRVIVYESGEMSGNIEMPYSEMECEDAWLVRCDPNYIKETIQ